MRLSGALGIRRVYIPDLSHNTPTAIKYPQKVKGQWWWRGERSCPDHQGVLGLLLKPTAAPHPSSAQASTHVSRTPHWHHPISPASHSNRLRFPPFPAAEKPRSPVTHSHPPHHLLPLHQNPWVGLFTQIPTLDTSTFPIFYSEEERRTVGFSAHSGRERLNPIRHRPPPPTVSYKHRRSCQHDATMTR